MKEQRVFIVLNKIFTNNLSTNKYKVATDISLRWFPNLSRTKSLYLAQKMFDKAKPS